jgi:maleate isomerase
MLRTRHLNWCGPISGNLNQVPNRNAVVFSSRLLCHDPLVCIFGRRNSVGGNNLLLQPLRIGPIVPSSNTVMEPDFHQHIGPAGVVSTTRIFLEDVTRDAEIRMLEDELPKAVEHVRTTAPDVVVFGCTSAGALGTLAHNDGIGDIIKKKVGARVVTVLGAVLTKVRTIGPRNLALFTPYAEDLTNCVASSLAEAGYPPVKAVGMGFRANLEIGRVPPSEIIRFVEFQIEGCVPDCLFLSCTNWHAIEAIEPLQQKLGIPVVTSNQAAIDEVRQAAGNRLSIESRI